MTEDPALADSLLRMIRRVRSGDGVSLMLYRSLPNDFIARLSEADIFILGLFRQYPGGMRAEGVALASLMLPRGRRVLVVSPLHVRQLKESPIYWDTASTETLEKMLRRVADGPIRKDAVRALESVFRPLLEIPQQH